MQPHPSRRSSDVPDPVCNRTGKLRTGCWGKKNEWGYVDCHNAREGKGGGETGRGYEWDGKSDGRG